MHIHATVQHLIHSIKRWKICAYPLCMTGWVPVGVVGPWPFADRVEEKTCSPQLLQHSDVQKAYARAIQPVGCSGGQGRGVQMCERPRAMRQLWLWTTRPTLGAGHELGAQGDALVALTGVFLCVAEQSCMRQAEGARDSSCPHLQNSSPSLTGCVSMRKERPKLVHQHETLWGEWVPIWLFWVYCTSWTTAHRMPLEKEIAF